MIRHRLGCFLLNLRLMFREASWRIWLFLILLALVAFLTTLQVVAAQDPGI